ncbi:glycerate kinase type-2 family protein [Desulfocicer niacini]
MGGDETMQGADNLQAMKKTAMAIFQAAIAAVAPETCVRRILTRVNNHVSIGGSSIDLNTIRHIYLVGAGKASAAMVGEAEIILGDCVHDGLVITKYGHGVTLRKCQLMEAGHPLPDENGVRATHALLSMVATAGPDDLIICMISGGGSALTPAPAEGITLADKQHITRLLLGCGATIHEINTIRKHLSRIKGGQLCRHTNGARVISLILSDVIGDDLDIIASGITASDGATFEDCRKILDSYDLWHKVSETVAVHIEAGKKGKIRETPKPGDELFDVVDNHIVGSLSDALDAAEKAGRTFGYTPVVLSSSIQGEAGEVAKVLCAVAREVQWADRPVKKPACVLSGGETTVTLKGEGKGGRNMELALSAGIELAGIPDILLLSVGTDGSDGPTEAAGAFADGTTSARAKAHGLSMEKHLAHNNSHAFFEKLGDLFITGPTRTNVMDLQIFLIDG